ncbi:helix-turn-helix transcriptional regulator [Desertivirga brevis]|uniref:helix-turn-helix transcriptional regulator n=1 Tax=Desertivirga brevis TaxID=2810310 RepID=UPI001A974F3A|nr:YafY family protein [Pedobacter sp. SYSU D00873]
MNRIDRISAILIQLQTRRVVKAQDIADRFSISLRTVYRDIKTLEEAGIPIIGEAGVGYSLVDGFRLPPVMFTREEATAFLTAEKLVEQLTDSSLKADFTSAMYKVRAVLKSTEKDLLEEIDSSITVLNSRRKPDNPLELNLLQNTLKSIAEKKALHIHYFTAYRQEATERIVEPVGVFFLDNYWHLIAWCRMRQDYRDFRLDRVSDICLTGSAFEKEHMSLQEYLSCRPREENVREVVVLVNKRVYHFLEGQKYYSGFISEVEKGDKVEMHFLTSHLTGFARWFLMFADEAIIIGPEELKEQVKRIATGVLTAL